MSSFQTSSSMNLKDEETFTMLFGDNKDFKISAIPNDQEKMDL